VAALREFLPKFMRAARPAAVPIEAAALGSLQANVMIADNELNIISMNPAAHKLMREAEPELKRELPHFDAGALIGRNIDIFHKNPGHQRGMLARLQDRHAATIRIGTRVLDLLVTPLTDKGARRGFVVEWSDAKHRLANVDYAAQIAAIHRYQSVIEFDTQGVILFANTLFLKRLGYTLEEVTGRHHSMFLLPGERDTADCIALWDGLRSCNFRAGQFRRRAKDDSVVWIEGAYNPILDEKGRVAKVMKFATIARQRSRRRVRGRPARVLPSSPRR
jgi:PAS domain S-box-containing protein